MQETLRDAGLIPQLGRSPGEGSDNPTLVFLPGESHGQKNVVGCGHEVAESDTT